MMRGGYLSSGDHWVITKGKKLIAVMSSGRDSIITILDSSDEEGEVSIVSHGPVHAQVKQEPVHAQVKQEPTMAILDGPVMAIMIPPPAEKEEYRKLGSFFKHAYPDRLKSATPQEWGKHIETIIGGVEKHVNGDLAPYIEEHKRVLGYRGGVLEACEKFKILAVTLQNQIDQGPIGIEGVTTAAKKLSKDFSLEVLLKRVHDNRDPVEVVRFWIYDFNKKNTKDGEKEFQNPFNLRVQWTNRSPIAAYFDKVDKPEKKNEVMDYLNQQEKPIRIKKAVPGKERKGRAGQGKGRKRKADQLEVGIKEEGAGAGGAGENNNNPDTESDSDN